MSFGILTPSSVNEVNKLDKATNNELLNKAIQKELKNVNFVFLLLGNDESIPFVATLISYHFIIDVKFDFRKISYWRMSSQRYTNTLIIFLCSINGNHTNWVIILLH